jgi:hypothetical protein
VEGCLQTILSSRLAGLPASLSVAFFTVVLGSLGTMAEQDVSGGGGEVWVGKE